ncbi:MAG: NACHT domain-containing protein [Nitrospira sp.]
MKGEITSAHKLAIMILALGVLTILTAHFFTPTISMLTIGVFYLLLLLLVRPLLFPPGYGAMRVRSLTLLGVFGLAGSYSFWSPLINIAAKGIAENPNIRELAPWLTQIDFQDTPSIAVLGFTLLALWIVHYYMADPTIGGNHPKHIDHEFPEETFPNRLGFFCSALRHHLITTDRETNWSSNYYTDLEADVDIIAKAGDQGKRKVLSLQRAIRQDKTSQTFLILGDPGAGKSVALRRLAIDMLDEVHRSGRVPIYINLREWLPQEGKRSKVWSEQSKPVFQELVTFVIDSIKARGDLSTEDFVDQYFRKMWQAGHLFFIFDSFDEIPELLDANEESWLIEALSGLLSRFISSNPLSRGVLASRHYRRPTSSFLAEKILVIRPLNEERINHGLKRFSEFTQSLLQQLFRDRPDLVPVARNPFLMTLLGEWVKEHRGLPSNPADLYSSYLIGRLNKCERKIAQAGLSVEGVLRGAIEIAWFVFESPTYGLEAPVNVIGEERVTENAFAIIEILEYARIARVTHDESKSFAFVHRRFLEYLVSRRFLEKPGSLPTEHIPTDSRGRDALVLYAQVCDEHSARTLAVRCWTEISANFDKHSTRLRAIHSLRFLIDAFRLRRSSLESFMGEFSEFIRKHVSHGEGLLQAKIALEATALLSPTEAIPSLSVALSGKNSWLQETAFRACRHLPNIETDLQRLVANYVISMPVHEFLENYSSLKFSLSLSESLKQAYNVARIRYYNTVVACAATFTTVVIAPKILLFGLLVATEAFILKFIFSSLSAVGQSSDKKSFLSIYPAALEKTTSRAKIARSRDLELRGFRLGIGTAAILTGSWLILASCFPLINEKALFYTNFYI